ncbi:MAG: hypothetical protein MZV70_30085 [Desulfobacterales bacterium]|nr:hypothetical protein [Desulfobacterales bacterium]
MTRGPGSASSRGRSRRRSGKVGQLHPEARTQRSGGHSGHAGVHAHGHGPRAPPADRLRAAGGPPGDAGGGHGPGAERRSGRRALTGRRSRSAVRTTCAQRWLAQGEIP